MTAIILLGGVQGLLLVLAIRRLDNANHPANRILSTLVLMIALVLFSRLVYVDGVEIWQQYPHLFLLPDIPMFFYGPLLYLYICRLVGVKEIRKWQLGLHFVPAALHLLILSYYLFESREVYMQRLVSSNLIELPYVVWLALGHLAVYLVLGYVLFRSHAQKGRFEFGKQYLNSFFFTATACWASWLYAALSNYTGLVPSFTFFNYNLAWVALSFSTFILAYFAMSKPEVFRNNPALNRYKDSPLSQRELNLLEQQLIGLMAKDKPYLIPQLNQQQLAKQMKIAPRDLSRLINERFGQNYFDFINSYRVAEFKRLSSLPKYQHLSLLGKAYEAGFNSKTTFHNAVKKHTGMTPSQFVKK
ncbi:MAG: helix-turn-helix domain-containing protein [Chitinophagales bacterium]|nr:helix-turn-helix domain-containing protein [Chitinophagales bacterium]